MVFLLLQIQIIIFREMPPPSGAPTWLGGGGAVAAECAAQGGAGATDGGGRDHGGVPGHHQAKDALSKQPGRGEKGII